MKLRLPLGMLSLPRRLSTLLVCETDGFTLRAAVMRREGDDVHAVYAADSRVPDLRGAMADVIGRLAVQGWTPGGQAALMMPAVIAATVTLPVPPDKPRTPLQMQELVRWELEPLLMEHTTLWLVGHILVGLGYLSDEQARTVLAIQQGKPKGMEPEARLEVFSLKRFGEIAIEQGFIERKQLDEALARQAWLRMEGEEIRCGWEPLPAHDGPEVADSGYRWLAAGVNQGLLQQWVAAFAEHHIALEWLFPPVGCAAALAPAVPNGLLLEVGGGLVAGIRLSAGHIVQILTHESSLNGSVEACLETWHGLTPPEPDVLWLADAVDGPALADRLAGILGREVALLEPQAGDAAMKVSAGMAGAARQILGMATARNSAVPARLPRPPLRSHPAFRLVLGGGLLLAGLLLAEGVLQVRQYIAETAAARVGQRAAQMDAAVARVQARIDAVKKLKDELKAKQDETAQADLRAVFLTEELPRRAAMLQALLDTLEEVVTEEVVIDRLAEEPGKGIVLNGWALSESSAQLFAESLRRDMASWNMALVDVSVTERIGRLSLPGYMIGLRIVDKATATASAAPQPAAATNPTNPVQRRKRRARP